MDYSDIIVQRFPILYLANVALTTYIMVQYHLATLRQMDYAAQLLEAKEAADRANAAKSDFLANMSHEIRTPINAVLGMNEMVLRESAQVRGLLTEDRQDVREALDSIDVYAGDVRSAGSNLLSIVNAILDFSKIEAGKMEIVEAPYSLGSLLNDVINLTSFNAEEKGLSFIADVDEALPDGLRGDKVRIRQALANVLGNALKYTEQGSVVLKVRGDMAQGCEAGRTIRLLFEVRDTGIGIKPEDLEKMFSKFQRVDMGRNSTIEGTGLGLAITESLLTMMNGSIKAESVYGSGSTFSIELPQTIVSCDPIGSFREQHDRGNVGAKAYVETFHAPDAHILIVDDTKMNLTVVTGLLRSTGLHIDTVTSGMQAIGLTQVKAYDLILMDQRMPEMDGIEALHRIRMQDEGANRETPIICLTADAVIGSRERYLSEGFTDYLTKPIDSQLLERMLVKHLPKDKVMLEFKEADIVDIGEWRDEERKEDRFAPVIATERNGLVISAGVNPPSVSDRYASLVAAGIDPKAGLLNCQGDEALYWTLIEEYVYGSEEKARDLTFYRETRDWGNLAIVAHSIKSSSMTIGAKVLSEIAANVERALDERNEEAAESNLPVLMTRYDDLVAAIRPLLPSTGESAFGDNEMEMDDNDILEFIEG